MKAGLAGLVLVVLTGCVGTTPSTAVPDGTVLDIRPTPPPGYPPRIGSVKAELDGQPVKWETYDYSIGAFDAAVQILGYNDELQFRLFGVPPGHPNPRSGALYIKAVMTSPEQTGALSDVVIEIPQTETDHGLRLASVGSLVDFRLDSVTRSDFGYGHVKGHFNALLCMATGEPARVNTENCQLFKGSFDSDLQFDDVERFR